MQHSGVEVAKFITKIASITKSIIIDIILKAERFGTLEFPKKKASELLSRLIRAKTDAPTTSNIVKTFFDVAANSLVASSENFDQNPDSAISVVQSICEISNSKERIIQVLQENG